MQTFLPHPRLWTSPECLDYRRLGKQRVETFQILNALDKRSAGEKGGWINHPATKMWEGHKDALTLYGIMACKIWQNKGYEDNMCGPIIGHSDLVHTLTWKPNLPGKSIHILSDFELEVKMPPWFGDPDFHKGPSRETLTEGL